MLDPDPNSTLDMRLMNCLLTCLSLTSIQITLGSHSLGKNNVFANRTLVRRLRSLVQRNSDPTIAQDNDYKIGSTLFRLHSLHSTTAKTDNTFEIGKDNATGGEPAYQL